MDLRLRLLTAEITILTAVASLFATNTEQWTKVYERRLFCEMQMNLWRGGYEQKAVEEIPTGSDSVPTGTTRIKETQMVQFNEVVDESQTSTEVSMQFGNEREAVEGVQQEVSTEESIKTETEMAAESHASESEVKDESQAEDEVPGEGTAGTAVDVPGEQPVVSPQIHEQNSGTQQMDVRPDPVSMGIPGAPLYQIDGDVLDPGVADYLYKRLCEAGIGWFYEFSVCLAYQESSFSPLAENPNGRDKGLFQFRVEFHPGLDWRNPYQQVDLFVQMMANRAAAGCDPYMMVSRHNTSDYCPEFNEVYVGQVLQHLPKLRRVK